MSEATLTRQTTPAVGAPPAQHDPVWMVQRAWSVFRLARLQELIGVTIADLHAYRPSEILGRDAETGATVVDCDPVAEALRACCEELRDAAGVTGAEADRARHCDLVRSYIQAQPSVWSETFAEALEKYRSAAARTLNTVFAGAS